MINKRKKRRLKRRLKRLLRLFILLLPVLIILFVLFFFLKERNKKEEKKTNEVVATIEGKEEKPVTATILTAGDILMQDPLLVSSHYKKDTNVFDYNSIFKYIKEDYSAADFTVVNLESTISNGNYRGYPRFLAPAAIATALAQNGTNACMLANNHIYDNYDDGMNMTINAIEANNMQYMGVRKSVEEKTYFIKDIQGIKVGFFNYVFDTGKVNNSNKSINSIPVSAASEPLINTFNYGNTQALYSEIQTGLAEMKALGVEYTIAYIHWGNEYQTTENSRQQQIAANLCELGIDALIGGHPHVIQPVDLLTNSSGDHQMICIYSIGNHLSDQYKERMDSMPTGHTEDGLMVNLTLQKNKDNSVSLIQVDFIPTWVYRTPNISGTENPEYFIFPLKNPNQIITKAGALDIATDVQESLDRTNAIIGNGIQKISNALPITNN